MLLGTGAFSCFSPYPLVMPTYSLVKKKNAFRSYEMLSQNKLIDSPSFIFTLQVEGKLVHAFAAHASVICSLSMHPRQVRLVGEEGKKKGACVEFGCGCVDADVDV